MTGTQWRIRLGEEAELDFERILENTRDKFGERQLAAYRVTLVEALAALAEGPEPPGSVDRSEILPNLRSLHVARKGRRGRHLILYRPASGNVVEVLRILYDGMDLPRHLPPTLG